MLAQQPIKTKSGTVRITDTSVVPGIEDDFRGVGRG